MVETINPVVHGKRRSGWALDVCLHVAGATIVAGAFGAALGAAGRLLGAPWGVGGPVMVAAVALAYAGAEAAGLRLPVPQAKRQVPDWWRTFFSRPVFSFLYGVGLGVGFLTYLPRGTLVVVSAFAFASGRPIIGMLVVAPFGLARSGAVLLAARVRTEREARDLVHRLAESSRRPAWLAANVVATGAIAAVAAGESMRAWGEGAPRLPLATLTAVFAWSAVSKAVRPAAWRRALGGFHLPRALSLPTFVAVPVAEAAVAGLCILGLGPAGPWLALSLLGVFSIAVIRERLLTGEAVPCGCFGARTATDWRLVLGRNALLAAVAAWALAQGSGAPPRWSEFIPRGGELIPAALAIGGVLAAAWMLMQVGAASRIGRRP
jgi:methylamine utilization protein MauE